MHSIAFNIPTQSAGQHFSLRPLECYSFIQISFLIHFWRAVSFPLATSSCYRMCSYIYRYIWIWGRGSSAISCAIGGGQSWVGNKTAWMFLTGLSSFVFIFSCCIPRWYLPHSYKYIYIHLSENHSSIWKYRLDLPLSPSPVRWKRDCMQAKVQNP